MGLKINAAPTFTALVKVTMPGGALAELEFTFAFKPVAKVQAWVEQSAAANRSDGDFLSEIVRDWRGVSEDDGTPVPYSREALEKLLTSYPAAATDIFEGYTAALKESRVKNSAPSLAT